MKVIEDVVAGKAVVERSIKEHGYFAEHNYHHYTANAEDGLRNVFFSYSNDMGILAQRKKDVWYLFAGVLAPSEKRFQLFKRFLGHTLAKRQGKKVVVEVQEDFRNEMLRKLDNLGYRHLSLNYKLDWPLLDLKKWDPKLPGKKWKKMRNLRNRLYKNHSVKIVDSKYANKEKLLQIVKDWAKWRNGSDSASYGSYINLINSNFKGCNLARTVYVDGKPCTINAGWKIPNTCDYYSAIGVFNYKHEGLGEVAMLDELEQLSGSKFRYVDMGGSDRDLLKFKYKFKPSKIYKTYVFSVVKK